MKICVRAHDLGIKGNQAIISALDENQIQGVQLVCYKSYEGIIYEKGGITPQRAGDIHRAFQAAGKDIALIGAYFNPVHSNLEKVQRGMDVFTDYLAVSREMGCGVVGSETGSFNDDKWTYHPRNRTDEALNTVINTFAQLCDRATDYQATVAMEGAAGHVCYDIQTLDKAQKAIGRPNQAVIFDLYNYMDESNYGDYMSILRQGLSTFEGRIHCFHMKDCQFVAGQRPKQMPFGQGELDLNAITREIKAYDPNATLVLEGTTAPYIQSAANQIKKLWESN